MTKHSESTRIVYMKKGIRTKAKKKDTDNAIVEEQIVPDAEFSEVKVVYEKQVIKKGKQHTSFGYWTKPFVMARLKEAYMNGANDTEAATNAGLIYDSFRQKLNTKIVVEVQGERDEITLRQLFDHWSESLILRLKKHVLKTADYSPLISGTADAWRWLERRRSKEFGLKAGQGSVDGNAPIDLSDAVALRAAAILKKRDIKIK